MLEKLGFSKLYEIFGTKVYTNLHVILFYFYPTQVSVSA